MTVKVQNRLKANELRRTELLADAGYYNGPNYEFLELRKITGWILVQHSLFSFMRVNLSALFRD